MYSIQHYVIKFVSDLWQTGWWFSLGTPVSSTNQIESVLNTKKQTNNQYRYDTIFDDDHLHFYSEQVYPLHLYHLFEKFKIV